ncbi:hypothetical protein [Rhodococcus jostii]|uniref:Secreted protein n=1 Tax=Rhodococcus jostii TaxID=132919 RepID=A0A1H4J794_RHOJO|nr:hypothetical protein [Rhodococcus jostii]RYE43713.1 MAG: hypothetical protein EOP24_27270 [Hyphomicrobiales bacterium]SEB41945.1 hypothetical protein SAMN04490220_0673 [Rhodococcus jostii]
MNKKVFAAVASATAAIAAVGLITAGTATAATPLGPTTNSCAPNNAGLPYAVKDGVFIPDTTAGIEPTGVHVRSVGTGSLGGDMPAKKELNGILIPTNGIGIGTLSGSYWRPDVPQCNVNGTFMLS